MEFTWAVGLVTFIILCIAILSICRKPGVNYSQPPAPPGWPVFGNIFSLGSVPHRSMAELALQYGPVFRLKFGSVNTVVISTTKAATELFKNQDLTFIDRNITETNKVHGFNDSSLALAPYGKYWRDLRKICTVELFAAKRINETTDVRRRCVDNMLTWIEEDVAANKTLKGKGVHVAKFVFLASFNLLGNLILSRDMANPDSKLASEFFTLMLRLMKLGGQPNISDFFPWLKLFDLQGLRRELDRETGKAIRIVTEWVEERVRERRNETVHGGERRRDFLDVLLDTQEVTGKDDFDLVMSNKDITIFHFGSFLAGTETTSSTIEWVLCELLRNPEKLSRAKSELDSVIGPNQKLEESSIVNLPYLRAIMKETLRLHPPLPFLIPRKATRDTDFMGYHIPKGSQLLVNAWAIGRDPDKWENPNMFRPERFLDSKVDFKGQHYEFIPFGAGRRMCIGLPVADRMIHLVLGLLLHEFDWDLEEHVKADTLDMKEQMGIVVRKLEPLKAIPKKCKL